MSESFEDRSAKRRAKKEADKVEREKGEKLSEFFAPHNSNLHVKRYELFAILSRYHSQRTAGPLTKCWRWIKASVVESLKPAIPPKGE